MFDFTFEPKITKEFLLSKNNEETYMSYYLGIPVKKGLFKSPLRNDSHVTCSFFRGKSGNLYFKDFASGECLTFEGVVMKKFNCNYREALKIIAKDFGLSKGKVSKSPVKVQPKFEGDKQTFIQVQIKEFEPHELKWWNSFGITKDILKKYNIYSCRTVFLNGSIFAQASQHCPIYGYYFGKKEGIEQWKIYMPKNRLRFIGNTSQKIIQGYHQLPKSGKLLIVTKSQKDCCLFARFDIPAIAPQSETTFLPEKLLEELKDRFDRIVVIFDTDLAGIRAMNKLRRKYPELFYYFIPRKYEAKDPTDFYRKFGLEKTKELLISNIKKLKNEGSA